VNMSIRKIIAILKKQIKDTIKNKVVLIQFLMFPMLTVIMDNAVKISGMPENYFILLFATMYIGMAPLTCMSSIISEEKESDTLRVLMMSNVKAVEYLIGEGIYVIAACMIGSSVFALQGNYQGLEFAQFMGIMFVGITTSTVFGAAIGIWSKNQMAAVSVSVPAMMVLAFVPMIAMFNESVEKYAGFLYTEQLNYLINNFTTVSIDGGRILIITANALFAICLFIVAYRKRGLLA